MSERRKGKVAQLPFATRSEVNSWLRDGVTYGAICARLYAAGFPDFNEMNISSWKDGGHQDWLKEQERLADMAAKREFAFQIVKANEGSKIHEAGVQLAASQLYEVLTEFDLGALKDLVKNKPENYAPIVNALTKLSTSALDIEKFKENVRERKEAMQKALATRDSKGGLTPETLELIEKELKLL